METAELVAVTKSEFTMDCLETWFKGYTSGTLWNGWSCPSFELEEGLKIVKKLREDWATDIEYNSEEDAFIVDKDTCDEDTFKSFFVNYKGEAVKVYAIGAFGWVWEDAKNFDLNNFKK